MIGGTPIQELQRMRPLLQDERVSDSDLVEILLESCNTGLYLLALLLLRDSNLAQQAVINAVSNFVTQRRDYWGEVSLVVWINRLVLNECNRARRGRFNPNRTEYYGLAETLVYSSEEHLSTIFLQKLSHLSEQQRAMLAMDYGQGLGLQDTAAILHVTITRAHIILKTARQVFMEGADDRGAHGQAPVSSGVQHTAFLEQIVDAADGLLGAQDRRILEYHLGECEACRDKARQLAEAEIRLREGLFMLLGEAPSEDRLHRIATDCLAQVDRRKKWKRFSLSSRQSLYLGTLVVLLLVVSGRIFLQTEGPAARIPGPTATAQLRTPDPWEGYIRFSYNVYPEDSLEGLAEGLGLSVEDIVELNHMRADSILSLRILNLVVPEKNFTPPPQVQMPVLPAGLTAQDSANAILERMSNAKNLVATLWGDYRFIHYGPPGYSGPPFLESRMQVWWHQSGHMVMITGMNSAWTSEVQTQYSIPSGFSFNRDRSSGSYFGYKNQEGLDASYFINPTTLVGLDGSKASLKVSDSTDHILGRTALVMDWLQGEGLYSARVWVDAERGLVLRLRLFEDASMQVTLMDFGFSDLLLDVDLPTGIFSPLKFQPDGYAAGFLGKPLPESSEMQSPPWAIPNDRRSRSRIPPPQGFDPEEEPLTMIWPTQDSDSHKNMVDVFAGEYYMGSLNIGQGAVSPNPGEFYASVPFNSCTRSPDGRLVAVSLSRLSKESEEPRIYWFELKNPENLRYVTSTMDTIGEFTFDPSSRYLVYYGCANGVCGLQILDTYSDSTRRLVNSIRFGLGSLTWSPDGKYLAFLGSGQGSSPRKVHVVRVSDGFPVYEADYGWEPGSIPLDSPTNSWGLPFPRRESFLPFVEGCQFPVQYPLWVGNDRLK